MNFWILTFWDVDISIGTFATVQYLNQEIRKIGELQKTKQICRKPLHVL